MKRFLLGVLVALLTLGALIGAGLLLAEEPPVPEETLPAETTVPETTVPETEATAATLPPETQPEQTVIDAVPLYYQTDYPHIRFGYGTMATSGCSVTCLAMIATYLTDVEYTPDQIAYHFGEFGMDHVERLDHGIAQMQLPCYKTYNVVEFLEALQQGKVAIAMMNQDSFFTDEQHFIVLAGMNEEGEYLVNDPYEPNYTRADTYLKDGYDNGFADYYIRKGFTGAWIFDKADMGDDPFLYDASLPEQLQTRYHGYTLSEEDRDILLRFVTVEAGSEDREVQQAVAEVVLNRMMSDKYGSTVYKVIYDSELQRATKNMAYAHESSPETQAAVEAAVYGPYVLPEDVCFYSPWTKGTEEWGKLGSFTFYKTG